MKTVNNSLRKSLLFLSSMAVVFSCNVSCSGGTTKSETVKNTVESSAAENAKKHECALVIPESIKKNVPEEMQYTIFLQMILSMIRNEYVNELSEGESVEKTIAGMLSSLDPHSSYLNEKAFAALKNQTDGEFGGLGIEIMMDESFVRIIS